MEPIAKPLGGLEQHLYRTRHEDGLLDVFVGLGVLAVGLDLRWGAPLGVVALLVLGPVLWRFLRREVSLPRLGHVRFGLERRAREAGLRRHLVWGLVAASVAGLVLFLVVNATGGRPHEGRVPYGAAVATAVGAFGVALGQRRLLLYAVLVLASFVAAIPLGGRSVLPATVLTGGGVIVLCGLVRFGLFLAKTPPPASAEDDARP